MQKNPLIIAMIFSSALLTSCGPKGVNVVKPPAELQTCANEPVAPVYPEIDWSSVETAQPIAKSRDLMTRTWVAAWRSVWGDCKAKVAGVKKWADELED